MLLISISPGAGAVASMSSGAAHGWRRGIWTAIGQQLALLFFLLISAVGLASLLASIPGSVGILSLLGAAYLAWVGLRLLASAFWRRERLRDAIEANPDALGALAAPASTVRSAPGQRVIPSTPGGLIAYGFLANAGNPKALLALFVITPRFIDPAQSLSFQYGLIAATMVAIDLAVMSGYTAIGSRILRALNDDLWQRRTDCAFGCLFLIAALLVARS